MLPWLGWPFVWLATAITVATLVELASWWRARRWNVWLTLLAGITLLYQLQLVAIACLGMADAETLLRLMVLLGTLSSLTTAAVASGMGARRIWSERGVVRPALSWFRVGAMGPCSASWPGTSASRCECGRRGNRSSEPGAKNSTRLG